MDICVCLYKHFKKFKESKHSAKEHTVGSARLWAVGMEETFPQTVRCTPRFKNLLQGWQIFTLWFFTDKLWI